MAEITSFVETLGVNTIFSVLMLTMWLGITAVYVPGTGFPEAGVAVGAVVVVTGLIVLPTSIVGLMLLGAAAACFLALVYFRRARLLIVAGFVLQLLGCIFLFRADSRPNIWLLAGLNAVSVAYYLLVLMPGLRIQERRRSVDADALIGATARVVATIDPVGSVRVSGETWRATSSQVVEAGSSVRITGRSGLRLEVEPLSPSGLRPPAE
jgi:membrane-bound serine protease (ClpP class)